MEIALEETRTYLSLCPASKVCSSTLSFFPEGEPLLQYGLANLAHFQSLRHRDDENLCITSTPVYMCS